MPERRAAVEAETGNAKNGELHRQYITLLAARIITGRIVNSGYFTVREGGGVEARRLKRVLVEPEADRVLWLHVSILLVIGQGERQWSPGGPSQWPANSCDDLLQSALQIVRILAARERTD